MRANHAGKIARSRLHRRAFQRESVDPPFTNGKLNRGTRNGGGPPPFPSAVYALTGRGGRVTQASCDESTEREASSTVAVAVGAARATKNLDDHPAV